MSAPTPTPREMPQRVRDHDWAATPLGPMAAWPRSLTAVVDMLLAHGFAMVALWGPELVQIYNDPYRVIMGDRHPAGLGAPTRAVWPEVWGINAPIYAAVRAGETLTFEDALYPITREGQVRDAWFTLTYSPLRDDDGAIAGVLVTVAETTARVLAERSGRAQSEVVRKSEARFRAFVTASSDVVYRMSPDWSEMRELEGRAFLADTREPNTSWLDHYILAEDQPLVRTAIERAIATRSLFEMEHRVIRADGSVGWTRSRAVPMLGDDGTIAEWIGAASDVTPARRAEIALHESEKRHRAELEQQVRDRTAELEASSALVRATVDSSPDMIQVFKAIRDEGGGIVDFRWLLNNRTSERLYGPAGGATLLQRNPGVIAAGIFDIFREVVETGMSRRDEHHYVHEQFDGWFSQSVVRLGDGVATTSTDITRRKAAEAELLALRDAAAREQAILIEELQHRTRNLLTVIGAVADRTLATSATLDEFGDRFDQRLAALGRAQGLLSRGAGPSVSVAELVGLELAAHGIEPGGWVEVTGPELLLPQGAVQLLALALHELSTNAVKHGAVRHGGRLTVTWAVADGRLTVAWVERGVPRPTDGPGFGRHLVETILPYELDAETSFAVTADGVRCLIRLDLAAAGDLPPRPPA